LTGGGETVTLAASRQRSPPGAIRDRPTRELGCEPRRVGLHTVRLGGLDFDGECPMSFPAAFVEAAQSEEFWTAYILDRGTSPEWPAFGRRCRVEVPTGGGYGLVFDLSRFLCQTDLSLRCPRRKRLAWLGRDDLAYWPREVMRWPEVILFCRAAARVDSTLNHPGVLLALLYRFTPLTAGDSRRAVWSLMRGALRALGVLSGRAIERCLRVGTSDERDGFAWREEECGWVLQDLSSGRYEFPRAPGGKFPFREFAAALRVADAVTEGAEPGAAPDPARDIGSGSS